MTCTVPVNAPRSIHHPGGMAHRTTGWFETRSSSQFGDRAATPRDRGGPVPSQHRGRRRSSRDTPQLFSGVRRFAKARSLTAMSNARASRQSADVAAPDASSTVIAPRLDSAKRQAESATDDPRFRGDAPAGGLRRICPMWARIDPLLIQPANSSKPTTRSSGSGRGIGTPGRTTVRRVLAQIRPALDRQQ